MSGLGGIGLLYIRSFYYFINTLTSTKFVYQDWGIDKADVNIKEKS